MAQPTPWRHALVVAMLAVLLLLPCGRPRCAAAADAADSASSSASSSSSSSSSSSRRSRLRGRRHALPPALQQPQPDAAAAGLWRDCPGVPHNWLPECWVAVHARVQIGGDRTFYWTPFSSPRWGNALSPYWQARALALLAGHGFHGYDGFDNTSWLGYLPKQVPPTTCPQMARFAQACDQCDSASWAYAHRCAGAWVWIQPTIVGDTRRAFGAWAAAVGYTPPPPGGPRDAVIQSRCSRDTLLSHDEYGPLAFSAYAALPSDTARITLVSDPHARVALCGRIHAALRAWLRARFPAAVVDAAGGQAHEDFARLLHAPRLFKDASSSFGLWAALANAGDVWAVPLLRRFTNNTRPDLGPSWHWVDAPVLYPHVAAAAGLSLAQPDAIIHWLETH